MLNKNDYRSFIEQFNREDFDAEESSRWIPNRNAFEWMNDNTPTFDCPDSLLTEIYYYRWWTYRKHIRSTKEGFVISEFLPDVGWAGPYNTISCALGHHFHEGRWIADQQILTDYARFWLKGSGKGEHVLSYSHWLCLAIYNFCKVTGNFSLATSLLDDLISYYEERCRRNQSSGGLYWSDDDRDGMEYTISGKGLRPTLNSYLCGDAYALSRLCKIAGRYEESEKYLIKHTQLKQKIQKTLWNDAKEFYLTRPMSSPTSSISNTPAEIREESGFSPWYFGAADNQAANAWKYLTDPTHFSAPYGPTSADMSDSRFMQTKVDHECLWDGPSWPFSTSITLGSLAVYLKTSGQNNIIHKKDYYQLLHNYAACHYLTENGKTIHWIDENIHPQTGEWLARRIQKRNDPNAPERGMAYNHSTFCDLVLSGLIGIDPMENGDLHIFPLTPDNWDYFAVDNLSVFGMKIGIYWDRSGTKYNLPAGFTITADGTVVSHAEHLKEITINIRKENQHG